MPPASEDGVTRTGPRHARQKRPHPWRRRALWSLLVVGVVCLLLVGAVGIYFWHLNSEIRRVTIKRLQSTPTAGLDKGTENILMVGNTSRCALKVQSPSFGLCSQGITGVNSDVVMILHLNPATHAVSVISIPRDLFIPNARSDGANKIDAALSEGPSQLVDAVQEDFGIPIQHYVELNFDSFAGVVDALGGVKMYFPEPVYDQETGLNIQVPGCVHLDGFQALALVRARHLQYKPPGVTTTDPAYWPQDPESDLSRIRRDHEFLRVLATAVAAKGLGNPFTDRSVLDAVAPQLHVDSRFSIGDMLSLVLGFHAVDINTAPQLTIPVMVDQSLDYYYQGYDYGNIELPIEPLDQQVIDQALGETAGTNTFTGQPLPAPSDVTVSVVNATGSANQAFYTGQQLHELGFQVTGVGDAPSPATESETIVYYAKRTPTDLAAAQVVAHQLSGAVVMALGPTIDGAEVTVQTGSDYAVNSAAPAPTTTTTAAKKHHGATTTTTAAPSTTGNSGAGGSAPSGVTTTTTALVADGFAPPTAANPALAQFDPRSCTPAGGEGT